MASLADELLQDFGDDGSDQEEEQAGGFEQDGGDDTAGGANAVPGMELDGDEEEIEDADAMMEDVEQDDAKRAEFHEQAAKANAAELSDVRDAKDIAALMKTLPPVMEKIAYFQGLPSEKQTKNIGSVEDNPEYKLLTQSNSLSTMIDSAIIWNHKFIRDHYSMRFPELEQLVTNPIDYAKTVAIIGNGPLENLKQISTSTDNLVGQTLNSVLDGPSLMVVGLEARTTRGQEMSASELETVRKGCERTLQLAKAKRVLTEYVESRMNIFAPNLTNLVGSLTAAQFLNFSGGLAGLAKTPACNIAPLGSKKQAQAGLATNVGIRHQGFLYHSPIIRDIQIDLRKQAMRIVSAKVVLAARIDRVHSNPDGSAGEELKEQCLERLRKLQEPPPNKGVRALPVPDDKPARKRGGRRARKAKEAVAMTELRKAQNRMAFGKEEKEVGYGDTTKGLGMIGSENEGRIRALQVDQRTRAKTSKKNPGWGGPVSGTSSTFGQGQGAGNATVLRGHGLRTAGVNAPSGTATAIGAFTPFQGLELVDPNKKAEMERKRKAEQDRWFSNGTFTQIGGSSAKPKMDEGGFKVPSLPSRRE
ncbi:Prp31 C terminal domain-containing protein [Eremomyces bilateralis CBS 781.70]|uniref:Prp31 C terminal domain-containing protein n=1 Tax=Eremomyces bilateralis CBS 781.70 TaxID=1392243 RepID=A0A6G1FXL3_9PEZI|nr:Prp31 C terminal domain-containing protein [Eremomyces bilateralis CBS 781.70]KAF1810349.1 Prp31 C terminal domain-containing protein [Eremomyces bilateralis CBS 781.70]